MNTSRKPVTVSLKELETGNVSLEALIEAFGPDSLGIIVVKDLPSGFIDLRHKLLSYSSYLANLPKADLDKLESPQSTYLTGWSLGKETLKDKRPDTLKGSYYINCAFHIDPNLHCSPTSPPHPTTHVNSHANYESFPEYTTPNLWPQEKTLPGFRTTATDLCNLIISTAALVARACDKFAVENVLGYETGYLEKMVTNSLATKARLLHYFPPPSKTSDGQDGAATSNFEEEESGDTDDWCATHVDHGCLTGLTSAMYVNEALCFPDAKPETTSTSTDEGGANTPLPLPELEVPPDPKAGLYIQSRQGEVVKVNIPRDCLAFQTGEALERVTKGRLKAVPHFVRGISGGGSLKDRVARNTIAVFTQPNLWDIVDKEKGIDFAGFARGVVEKNY